MAELARSDYRVRELEALVGESQNLVSYHLRLLRAGGLLTTTRSSFDGRDTYYHLDLDRCAAELAGIGRALHPALRFDPAPMEFGSLGQLSVLFICTGNSARSAIAEALFRQVGGGRVDAVSAGSHPKPSMQPNTVRVLLEDFGIDISGQRPRHIDSLADRRFDAVITLCDKAREVCPEFGDNSRLIHWSIADPSASGETGQANYSLFRATAAEIEARIRYLLPVLMSASV